MVRIPVIPKEHDWCEVLRENSTWVTVRVVDCWCGEVHPPCGGIRYPAVVEWVR